MEDTRDIFEKLVTEITSGERRDMLRRLSEQCENIIPEQQKRAAYSDDEPPITISDRFQEENFFIRLLCRILAFFSSREPSEVYANRLTTALGSEITRNFPGVLDPKMRCLLSPCREEFYKLNDAAAFFQGALSGFMSDRGGFYILLATFLMPEASARLASETDPFNISFDTDNAADVRSSLLRKMEDVFQGISETERANMYASVRSLEWLRKFCNMPCDVILSRFSTLDSTKSVCLLNMITDEIVQCAQVLSSPRNISGVLLETFFLFNNKERIDNGSCDTDREMAEFIRAAQEHLSRVKFFLAQVPMLDLARFALYDTEFHPAALEGGEDWFVAFKNAWKKRFDAKWSVWSREQRRRAVYSRICDFLNVEHMPAIAAHPWLEAKDGLKFRREYSLCFLKGFFGGVYKTKAAKPLKTLLTDGDFLRRDNFIEFTATYNALEQTSAQIHKFESRLLPDGDIGLGFAQIARDRFSAVNGKNRAESLMLTVDTESAALINQSCNAFRSAKNILDGVLQQSKNRQYESISNLMSINGGGNEYFRNELLAARDVFVQALNIAMELEAVELER